MTDPMAEVVARLQPVARFSKLVEAAGTWRMQRIGIGEPFYCALLHGECRLSVDDHPTMHLQAGDFVLVPGMRDLASASRDGTDDIEATTPAQLGEAHFRLGRMDGPADVAMRIGHCGFASPDAALLLPLLPQVVHVRGEPRLTALVMMVGEETQARRPARDVVLERLLEVLLIEALRCGGGVGMPPGLASGLADERLAQALRALHARPEHAWTVAGLASEAAMSRSAFFARFTQAVGVAPMEYLLAWRMALAKRMLGERDVAIAHIAERVGYSSASTFSVAFARQVGMSPARYGRDAKAIG